MADRSAIEWTDATWNIITGCTRVSRGCGGPDGGGCYAERLAATRLRNHPSRAGLTDANGRWNGKVRFNADWLAQPLRYSKPRKIFACAHSDLFHEAVPDEWIDKVFRVMGVCPEHTFQVLTKRPSRARAYLSDAKERIMEPVNSNLFMQGRPGREWPLSNVWLGVSAEDQKTYYERIGALLDTLAAVHWLSVEPLLGPMEIDDSLAGLDWVVAGGESGPRARLMDPAWARSLRNQCICSGTPFFFKQWGGRTSKAGGAVLDGREWRQFPDAA